MEQMREDYIEETYNNTLDQIRRQYEAQGLTGEDLERAVEESRKIMEEMREKE